MNNTQQDNWTLRDIWEVLLDNIWIYVISCIIAVAVAVAYIVVTPPQFERSASILIKDEDQDPMRQNFEDLGLVKSSTNISNEIRVLKTVDFMIEVVNRLSLESVYKQRQKGLRWVDLYKSTPFKIVPDSLMSDARISLELRFITPETFTISDLIINDQEVELGRRFEGCFDQPIQTPYGSMSVSSTLFYNPESIEASEYTFSRGIPKLVAKSYLHKLNITQGNEGTSIVNISLVDECPERAENIINTLISVYSENWIKDRNQITFSTSEFIDSRLSVIEQELESVDGSIAEFKSDKLMPDVAAVAGIQLQQKSVNNNEQLEIKNQLSMAKYIQDYLSSATGSDQLLPANTGIASGAIESQIAEYNELLLQKNLLMANSSENNPLVADMITNLNAIKYVINTSIKDHISTLSIQLTNLQNQESLNRANLSSTPKQAKELLGVERQQMIKEQLFLYLLQKREENELSQAFSAYNTKVLSAADGSPSPKEPKRSMILMLALAMGVIIPTLYIIVKESFDTIVKSKRDLEGLNIPFVGSIPFVANLKGKKRKYSISTVVNAGSRNSTNEAFRVLRTNLDFIMDGTKQHAQVVQLISLLPSSGKSFVTANLALSMALKDSKVLVMDCDIRKKTLSQSVTEDSVLGLSDYLSLKVNNLNELIIKGYLNENMDVLPVGTTPPNPSELLLKPRFAEIIDTMKERYDYIFIDCPPAEMVPDAAIVGKLCDSSIFIIRSESLDKRLLPEIESIYESKKFKNMSLLLNGVKSKKGKGYGYYGYGNYGYYGYGSES
ncbi:MAG: polysaccharide biosynthesis tyrosine autokinase [Rikenellaceae bacterium]